jgi:hypothetical protein
LVEPHFEPAAVGLAAVYLAYANLFPDAPRDVLLLGVLLIPAIPIRDNLLSGCQGRTTEG